MSLKTMEQYAQTLLRLSDMKLKLMHYRILPAYLQEEDRTRSRLPFRSMASLTQQISYLKQTAVKPKDYPTLKQEWRQLKKEVQAFESQQTDPNARLTMLRVRLQFGEKLKQKMDELHKAQQAQQKTSTFLNRLFGSDRTSKEKGELVRLQKEVDQLKRIAPKPRQIKMLQQEVSRLLAGKSESELTNDIHAVEKKLSLFQQAQFEQKEVDHYDTKLKRNVFFKLWDRLHGKDGNYYRERKEYFQERANVAKSLAPTEEEVLYLRQDLQEYRKERQRREVERWNQKVIPMPLPTQQHAQEQTAGKEAVQVQEHQQIERQQLPVAEGEQKDTPTSPQKENKEPDKQQTRATPRLLRLTEEEMDKLRQSEIAFQPVKDINTSYLLVENQEEQQMTSQGTRVEVNRKDISTIEKILNRNFKLDREVGSVPYAEFVQTNGRNVLVKNVNEAVIEVLKQKRVKFASFEKEPGRYNLYVKERTYQNQKEIIERGQTQERTSHQQRKTAGMER